MPSLNKTVSLAFPVSMALLTFSFANADPAQVEIKTNALDVSMQQSFGAADNNADLVLSFTEFTAFAKLRAQEGDETYKKIVDDGDFDLAFATRDTNADGVLTQGELSPEAISTSEIQGGAMSTHKTIEKERPDK